LAHEKASLFISLLAQRNEPKKRPIFQGVRDEAKACLYRSLQPESVTFETDLFRLSVIYSAKNAFRKYPFHQSLSCLRFFERVFLAHEKASLFISLLAQRNRNEPKKRPIFQGVRDEAKACLYRSLQPESVTFETDLFRLSVIYTAKNAFRKYPSYQARFA
jgi:anthranilate/para-aminobenzoate synthase component II